MVFVELQKSSEYNLDAAERMKNMNVVEIKSESPQKNTRIRLGAYCRVSSDSKDQLHSFAMQIRYYKDYERRNPQYKLIDIYADEGLTGTTMENRAELDRLIRDCQKSKIDRVIVKSVSRLARNTHDLLIILRTFRELGVSVYFEEQDIDTNKINAEMIVTFPGMLAQQESESISGNMRWSYKKRMESGEFNCCTPAYGYRLVDNQMVINEYEADVIRRIFNLYLQGYSMFRIANLLNEEQIPNRCSRTKWQRTAILYILGNERYMGDALLQKSRTTETLPFKRGKNRGELPQYYVENSNPPIVSREIFSAVQELHKSRVARTAQGTKHTYPLTRVLKCQECGWSFRRQEIKDTAYWVCSSSAVGESACRSKRLRENAVYDAFTNMLSKLTNHREHIIVTLIRQLEYMQRRLNDSDEQIRAIDEEISVLASKNLVISRLHANGILNTIDYTAQSTGLTNRITELRRRRKCVAPKDETDEQLDALKKLNDILADYEPYSDFDEELLSDVVRSITVVSNSQIIFHLICGLDLSEEIQPRGRCYCR